MSDIFKAGKRKYHRGSLSVSFTMNNNAIKKFYKLSEGSRKAIENTVSDYASRAPGWVSKGTGSIGRKDRFGQGAKDLRHLRAEKLRRF